MDTLASPARAIAAAILATAFACAGAHAHGLQHTVSHGDAVVITITHEDGSPFADQHYQVHYSTETVTFQTGRTDALGRLSFVPDRAGTWRVRAFSEDGHGVDVVVESDAGGSSPPSGPAPAAGSRWSRALVGISLLFGIFGVVSLFYRRRR